MLKPRTLKILVALLLAYGLLWLPAAWISSYPSSPLSLLLAVPLFSVYALHQFGVPGLLEHNGMCGWGWCAPTMLGWLLGSSVLVIGAWMIAWAMASWRQAKVGT